MKETKVESWEDRVVSEARRVHKELGELLKQDTSSIYSGENRSKASDLARELRYLVEEGIYQGVDVV